MLFGAMCTVFNVGGPGGTDCSEFSFAVHGDWDSREVIVAGVCDCVKERMNFVILLVI